MIMNVLMKNEIRAHTLSIFIFIILFFPFTVSHDIRSLMYFLFPASSFIFHEFNLILIFLQALFNPFYIHLHAFVFDHIVHLDNVCHIMVNFFFFYILICITGVILFVYSTISQLLF